MAHSSPSPNSALIQARDEFVSLWGQMGSTWGIPRTMAQVHALLLIHDEPLNTDEVMAFLDISRGNASQTLRGLVDWGIVSRVHRRGDRKEYFSAERDIWKMFRTILAHRKKREVDPLLEALINCRALTDQRKDHKISPEAQAIHQHNECLDELIGFIQIVNTISERFITPGGEGLEQAAKLLGKAS